MANKVLLASRVERPVKSTCVVKVSVLDVPETVAALRRLTAAVKLLASIEQDSRVPAEHRQHAREWREQFNTPPSILDAADYGPVPGL